MRSALWLVGLFAVAVAVALFAGDNPGTVTVFWPPHRVDLSVNLVVVLLVLLFVLVYLSLRAIAAMVELPRQARRWRSQQRERATHALLLDAMTQFAAGRYLRARKAAEGALLREQALAETGESPPHAVALRAQAHMLAADSAHALQDRSRRDAHLARALGGVGGAQAPAELREGVLLRAARWALHDRDPLGALARLEELPTGAHRRTAALRIKLKAARQSGRSEAAMDTARLLAKHRAFSPEAARSLVRGLAVELIRGAHDPAQLEQVWNSLDATERAMPELALRAAQRMLALGGSHAVVRQWLKPVWDRMLSAPDALDAGERVRLVRLLQAGMAERGESTDQDWLGRVEAAAQANPRDATLQYLAGMACLHRGLWGRAQLLLTQATRTLQDEDLRRQAWCALAELAEQRGDEVAASEAWRRAAVG